MYTTMILPSMIYDSDRNIDIFASIHRVILFEIMYLGLIICDQFQLGIAHIVICTSDATFCPRLS